MILFSPTDKYICFAYGWALFCDRYSILRIKVAFTDQENLRAEIRVKSFSMQMQKKEKMHAVE